MKNIGIFLVLILFVGTTPVFGYEPIKITKSAIGDGLVLDGKWTFMREWKATSLDKIRYDDNSEIAIRSAHYGDYIYFLIVAPNDFTKDRLSDKATICFDTNNDKANIPLEDDYCFVAPLDSKQGHVLQGGSSLALSGHFEKINSPSDFFAVGSITDSDRHGKFPHATYEFIIPTDLISRQNIYGLYIGVFDANNDKLYTYPKGIEIERSFTVPPPSQWGELISPDKSIPEFNLPLITMILSIGTILFFTRAKSFFRII